MGLVQLRFPTRTPLLLSKSSNHPFRLPPDSRSPFLHQNPSNPIKPHMIPNPILIPQSRPLLLAPLHRSLRTHHIDRVSLPLHVQPRCSAIAMPLTKRKKASGLRSISSHLKHRYIQTPGSVLHVIPQTIIPSAQTPPFPGRSHAFLLHSCPLSPTLDLDDWDISWIGCSGLGLGSGLG